MSAILGLARFLFHYIFFPVLSGLITFGLWMGVISEPLFRGLGGWQSVGDLEEITAVVSGIVGAFVATAIQGVFRGAYKIIRGPDYKEGEKGKELF